VPDLTAVVASSLRNRRRALGLTQAGLAEAAEVSTELVSRVERARCLPSVTTLVAFARALGCSPNDLLGFERSKAAAREAEELWTLLQALPNARRKEVRRIAEALARYERSGS
jgi:transcriptional regulator with XRE-family HTH domain